MKKDGVKISVVVCTTIVLLASIGGWIYVNKNNVALKNKELAQQKEISEKEQRRRSLEKQIEVDCAYHSSTSFGEPTQIKNAPYSCDAAREELKKL